MSSPLSRPPAANRRRKTPSTPFEAQHSSRHPLWTENLESLLLENASTSAPRLVAGCQVSSGIPPAPRLVGIETNPGPPRSVRRDILSLGVDGARALGAAVGSALKKKKKSAPKKAGARSSAGFANRMLVSRPSRPDATVSQLVTLRRSPTIKVPFDVATMGVFSDAAGKTVFGSPTSGIFHLELDPNLSVAGAAVFGPAIGSLSSLFKRARLNSLRVLYIPMVNTSTDGSITFAATSEGAYPVTTPQAFPLVAGQDGAATTPVWASVEIPSRARLNEWIYVQDAAVPSVADARTTSFGVILTSNFQTLTVSKPYGLIRLVGEMEMEDLGPFIAL